MGTTKYIVNAFAIDGDRTVVPDTPAVDGSISYTNGWTAPYSYPYPSNPSALPVSRTAWNQVAYDTTLGLQQYQQVGVPNFISTSDNDGSPYLYSEYSFCIYDDGVNGPRVFQSKINNNNTLPTVTANWIWVDNCANKIIYDNVTFEGGVTNGQAVYFNGTTFAAAVANGTSAQNVIGIADVTFSRVYALGLCNAYLSGLTPGVIYYLSSSVAGALTSTMPLANVVSVGIAYNATTLLLNIQEAPAASAWAPWTITGLEISPGTAAATQYNVSAGSAVDQSGLVNCVSNSSLTNKSVAATWAQGSSAGAVVAADYPLAINSTCFIFEIWKADKVTFDSAITNDPSGANILADGTISGAGYIYCRRIAKTFVPALSTIRPILQNENLTMLQDDLESYNYVYTNSAAIPGSLVTSVNLSSPSAKQTLILFISNQGDPGNSAVTSLTAVNPVGDQTFVQANGFETPWSSAAVPVISDSSGNVLVYALSGSNGSGDITAVGWWDFRVN